MRLHERARAYHSKHGWMTPTQVRALIEESPAAGSSTCSTSDAVAAAIPSGMDGVAIAEVVEDLYYMDMGCDGASRVLWDATGASMPQGVAPHRPQSVQEQFALF